VITVTVSEQVLASSTARLYAEIVNNCNSDVYLTADNDIDVTLTTGFKLVPGGVWKSNEDLFIYTGSVRASSTNETACDLHISEY